MKSPTHTFVKDGIFYFVRYVPKDLRRHYTSGRISYSLRTRSASVAAARAVRASAKLDEYWFHLRSQETDIPGKHLLRGLEGVQPVLPTGQELDVNIAAPTLSEGVLTYLRLKGAGKPKTFHRAAERSCGYVIDVCGDKALTDYTRKDANALRDALLARGMAGSSITRVFGTIRSVINFAANEEGLSLTNPFGGVYYDRTAGTKKRLPIPIESIRVVQAECFRIDDEIRWLVALVADTGMRLAEAAGLMREDFYMDNHGNYYANVTPHPWRRLKTAGSEREVPLHGSAQWAAQRILAVRGPNEFAFPRYNTGQHTNANSASAALNKWLKPFVPDGVTMHGFRHAMRDRLRAVECPADIVDQIGGWQTDGVGQGYGTGYPRTVLGKWTSQATCGLAGNFG